MRKNNITYGQDAYIINMTFLLRTLQRRLPFLQCGRLIKNISNCCIDIKNRTTAINARQLEKHEKNTINSPYK